MVNNNVTNKKEENVDNLFSSIAVLIEQGKRNVKVAIDNEVTKVYWNIGRLIKSEILNNEKAGYGENIVNNISVKLIERYGKGYSRANLFRMIKFYDYFKEEIVATVSRQLYWSHFVELLKIEDELKREFYLTMCINENWSVRILNDRIKSRLFERTAISKKPEKTIINDLKLLNEEKKMTTNLFFRDPYLLDFLGLKETYSEKDLENAILYELENFLLEMGSDFAFLARQKRIIIDGEDYYIDLLFYHRKMKRLVVIELKLDKFRPQDKGQIELYLRWLEKYEMNEGEDTPLGIILCAEKKTETVELLELDKSGIHVAQYLTELPPKEIMEEKLRIAIEKAKQTVESNYISKEREE